MPKGTVRITFRLPYDTDDAKNYEGAIEGSDNNEILLEQMARYDVENFPEALESEMPTEVTFKEWVK